MEICSVWCCRNCKILYNNGYFLCVINMWYTCSYRFDLKPSLVPFSSVDDSSFSLWWIDFLQYFEGGLAPIEYQVLSIEKKKKNAHTTSNIIGTQHISLFNNRSNKVSSSTWACLWFNRKIFQRPHRKLVWMPMINQSKKDVDSSG